MRQGEWFSGVQQPYLHPPGSPRWDLESQCKFLHHLSPAFPCAEQGEWFSGTVGTWSCFTPTFVLCSHMKGHYANYSLRASSSESREIPRKETRVRGAGFAARSLAINGWLARRLRKLYHLSTLTRQTNIKNIPTTTNNFRVYIHLFGGGSNRPDEPDEPVQVGTPLAAPRHCRRDRLSALTAFSATRFASLSTKAKSGLLDSMMTSCFKALCTPIKLFVKC